MMYHGMGLKSVILKPGIKNEEIQPSAYLNHRITNIRYVYKCINYSTQYLALAQNNIILWYL